MNELTGLSEKYLEEFLAYCRKKRISMVIVGGWAVYSYVKNHGLKDMAPKLKQL